MDGACSRGDLPRRRLIVWMGSVLEVICHECAKRQPGHPGSGPCDPLLKGHKQVHRAEDPLAKEARVSKGPLE